MINDNSFSLGDDEGNISFTDFLSCDGDIIQNFTDDLTSVDANVGENLVNSTNIDYVDPTNGDVDTILDKWETQSDPVPWRDSTGDDPSVDIPVGTKVGTSGTPKADHVPVRHLTRAEVIAIWEMRPKFEYDSNRLSFTEEAAKVAKGFHIHPRRVVAIWDKRTYRTEISDYENDKLIRCPQASTWAGMIQAPAQQMHHPPVVINQYFGSMYMQGAHSVQNVQNPGFLMHQSQFTPLYAAGGDVTVLGKRHAGPSLDASAAKKQDMGEAIQVRPDYESHISSRGPTRTRLSENTVIEIWKAIQKRELFGWQLRDKFKVSRMLVSEISNKRGIFGEIIDRYITGKQGAAGVSGGDASTVADPSPIVIDRPGTSPINENKARQIKMFTPGYRKFKGLAEMTAHEVSNMFDVSVSVVKSIWYNKRWTHVQFDDPAYVLHSRPDTEEFLEGSRIIATQPRSARLSDEAVMEIWGNNPKNFFTPQTKRYTEEVAKMARKFNVDERAVRDIWCKRTYKKVIDRCIELEKRKKGEIVSEPADGACAGAEGGDCEADRSSMP